MNDRIEKIISLIFATRRMMFEQKDPKEAKSCSFLHLITLKYIKEGSPLMKDIATFLGIAPPSATSLINNLAKSELVKRSEDKIDRRIVRIEITKEGEKYLHSHKRKTTDHMRKNLEKLTHIEQEQLRRILEKISKID